MWWSCYVRDRIVSQYSSRPLRIKDDEFNTPQLTLDDFDLDDIDLNGIERPPHKIPMSLSRERQTEIAQTFMMTVKLCILNGAIMTSQFEVTTGDESTNTSQDVQMHQTLMLPKSSTDKSNDLANFDTQLQDWHSTLPACCQYQTPYQADVARFGIAIFVQRCMLHLEFFNTILTLHRPHAVHPLRKDRSPTDCAGRSSWEQIYQASQHSIKICRDLRSCNLEAFLFSHAASLSISLITVQLTHLQYCPADARNETLLGIFHCTKVLETMQDMYIGGDFCAKVINMLLQKSGFERLLDPEFGLYGFKVKGATYDFLRSQFDIPLGNVVDLESLNPRPYYTGFGSGAPVTEGLSHQGSPSTSLGSPMSKDQQGATEQSGESSLSQHYSDLFDWMIFDEIPLTFEDFPLIDFSPTKD